MRVMHRLAQWAAVLGCVICASVALASEAAAETPVPWWGKVLIALASAFGTAIVALLARLLNRLFAYFARRAKLAFLADVDEVIIGFVSETGNELVEHAKVAAKDGKLTKAERNHFKRIPIRKAKEHFGLEALGELVGSVSEDVIDRFLGSRVEKAVTIDKAVKATSAPVPPSP